jgi:hypothetical protein
MCGGEEDEEGRKREEGRGETRTSYGACFMCPLLPLAQITAWNME